MRPVVGGCQICSEPIEHDMLAELLTSLKAALRPWLPVLGLLLGVGGPFCIYLQGRSAAQVAEITAGAQVAVAEINAAAQVEVARVTAAGAAQGPEVPRKRQMAVRSAAAQVPGRDY